MLRALALSVLCLAAAAPAFAQDGRPRLVTGATEPIRMDGARFSGPDLKAPLISKGGLTLGALADSTPLADDVERFAAGGFAAYTLDAYSLTSSLRGDAAASAVDLGAAYTGGLGSAALTLGYEWAGRPATFSLNPAQPAATILDAAGPASDLSLTLSFTHDVSSALHVGGFAAASRSEYEDRTTEQGFKLGAGLGYRF